MREVLNTAQFKRDFKKLRLNETDEFKFLHVLDALIMDESLNPQLKDHALVGTWIGCRECHLKPDLLLIYKLEEGVVKLMRIGSHSNLFN